MNILVINWRCIKNPEMGGAEIHLHEIFKRIASRGHQVTLVAHKFPNAQQQEIVDGIKIIRIGNKFFFNHQFKSFYEKALSNIDYDLVVDDISKIPLFTPNYIKKPLVGIIHHIHGDSLYKEIAAPLAYYIINKEKKIPQYYNKTPIFCVSESTKKELVALGQPENKIDFLYNAIDQELFKSTNYKKSETPLLVYVGRIKKYKNLKNIINSVEILKKKTSDFKLIIAGTGSDLNNLKKLTKKKGLQNWIEFSGYITESEKAKLLGSAWIFITTPFKEGWGITVIEANAMGTPAIGSDVPGLRDSIKNNETGILVSPDNPVKLAEEVYSLIMNKEKLKNLSEAAKNWSHQFNWDNSAEHFLQKVKDWYNLN
jgi:glycosyltransferase involved in cell wall biosynthesis